MTHPCPARDVTYLCPARDVTYLCPARDVTYLCPARDVTYPCPARDVTHNYVSWPHNTFEPDVSSSFEYVQTTGYTKPRPVTNPQVGECE